VVTTVRRRPRELPRTFARGMVASVGYVRPQRRCSVLPKEGDPAHGRGIDAMLGVRGR